MGSDAVEEDDAYFARSLSLLDIASGELWTPCSRCDLPGDPRWSDDGSRIGFVADRNGHRETLMFDVERRRLLDLDGSGAAKEPSCALSTHQNVPLAARSSVAPSGDEPQFAVDMACARTPSLADSDWQEVRWRATGRGVSVGDRSGADIQIDWRAREAIAAVQAIRLGKSGVMVVRVSAKSGHTALFLAVGGKAHLLMDLNSAMQGVEPAMMLPLPHRSVDGASVTSWLFLPPGHAQARSLPMVVIPYPGQVYNDTAPLDQQVGRERFYTNAQLLAASGFAVLLPSIPMPAILPDAGFDFAAALGPAIDAARATGHCDPDRMALWGHSYGGYSVAMAGAQSDRFRAIIASAGIYDLAATAGTFGRQMRLSPDEGLNVASSYAWAEVGQGRMGVPPWRAPTRYVANSPIYFADRVKVPMLIVGADRDFSPVEQGEQLFSALFRQGKDAQLVTYWGEGHVIGSPANLRDFYARVIAFLRDNLAPRRARPERPAAAAPSSHATIAPQ